MKLRIYLILLFISFYGDISATWQRSVTNYYRNTYNSGNQNWMISQQENGWMYFANNKGLLEFDGGNWNTYSIHNAKTRAVKVGADGRIYIGGMGQFGYFTPNRLGGLEYTCLSDSIDGNTNIGIIWNIHIVDNRIYFQSEWNIYCLDKGRIRLLNASSEIWCSAVIHGKFYVALEKGLAVLKGTEIVPLSNIGHTAALNCSAKIVALLPWEDKVMIVTSKNGLFVYDGNSILPYKSAADPFIHSNLLFCAEAKDGLLALGSVQGGVLLLDSKTGQLERISIDNGLQNKTVLGLYFDRSNNLWLGLDNGIDCIHLESPIFSLYGGKAVIGSGYASCYYNGQLYLGTNQGLYRTSLGQINTPVDMQFMPGTDGQVWSIKTYNNQLFCCADNGIFIIDGMKHYSPGSLKGVWSVVMFPYNEHLLIAGTYSGMFLLGKSATGRWEVKHKIKGFSHSCKTLFIEEANTLWVANKGKGIFRITLTEGLDSIMSLKNYNNESLSNNNNSFITRINRKIVVAAHEGLYYYDQINDQLVLDTLLEQSLDGHTTYTYLKESEKGDIWYVVNGKLKLLRSDGHKGFYKLNNEAYFCGALIEDFENIYFYDKERAIIGTEDGFALLKYNEKISEQRLGLQIRKVYCTGKKDSLVYGRSYTYDQEPLVLPYSKNSIRIEYIVTDYDESSTALYSCRLAGGRANDNEWSEYSENNTKEYTDLPEGSYVFNVKIITDKAQEPIETSFSFEILPPWYRMWWAYCVYGVLVILFLYYIYYRIVQSRKNLIRQKELELISQKQEFRKESELKDRKIVSLEEENLQSELRHKSEELIKTTLNIVHKNEILQDIRKVAVGISRSVNDENLVNIRRKTLILIERIDKDLDNEEHWQTFQNTFDSVHHNFFHLLDERYPDLSYKDKMLCAYLRMNLMSKEIAPLLNITLRGVEISRYRLRKKLGLGEGDNLAEFLQHLT